FLGAAKELMIPERWKYRDLLTGPLGRLAPEGRVVVGLPAAVDEVAADQDRHRLFARDPGDERAARALVRHLAALGEAGIAVDDEGHGARRHPHVKTRRSRCARCDQAEGEQGAAKKPPGVAPPAPHRITRCSLRISTTRSMGSASIVCPLP